jgi:hypothetical protein
MRDCASALVVGGSGVAVALLASGAPIRAETFAAFYAINGLLLVGLQFFAWRALHVLGHRQPRVLTIGPVLRALWLIIVGILFASSGKWPMKAYTTKWWMAVALALIVAAAGARNRHFAEEALEVSGSTGAV